MHTQTHTHPCIYTHTLIHTDTHTHMRRNIHSHTPSDAHTRPHMHARSPSLQIYLHGEPEGHSPALSPPGPRGGRCCAERWAEPPGKHPTGVGLAQSKGPSRQAWTGASVLSRPSLAMGSQGDGAATQSLGPPGQLGDGTLTRKPLHSVRRTTLQA